MQHIIICMIPPLTQDKPPEPPQAETLSSNIQVGDRVLVDGVIPGVVAFLGSTQFASGVWAGVILDTYDGKNDGSVDGVSYFVCEPNRGLFTRPEKLTLVLKEPKTLSSPQGQKLSLSAEKFKVGDRIFVDGEKPGIVCFIGKTQFAQNELVGIALDHPDGANNGSVKGVRYFQCQPNHGLFARPQRLTFVKKSNAPIPNLKVGDHAVVKDRAGVVKSVRKGISWTGVELMGDKDGSQSGKR